MSAIICREILHGHQVGPRWYFCLFRMFVISGVLTHCCLWPSPRTAWSQSQGPTERVSFTELEAEFDRSVLPVLKEYCCDCHATDVREGQLDLERYITLSVVRSDPAPWQRVTGMLESGEMPPEDSPQLSQAEQTKLLRWVRSYLDAEALAQAGDPGPVTLRRLNNAEYTYSIQDLTGNALQPTREFPVDGAAGEGFTNTGNALVMSPALLEKYITEDVQGAYCL